MHVALVGDSHLAGDSGSSARVKLAPRLRDAGFTVANFAFGGARATDVRAGLTALPTCDWAIYSLGTNDAAPWKAVVPEEFARAYADVLQVPGPRARVVLAPGPVRDRGDGRSEARIAIYRESARAMAAQAGAECVDLSALLGEDCLGEDGVHLNDRGYALLADAVCAVLNGG